MEGKRVKRVKRNMILMKQKICKIIKLLLKVFHKKIKPPKQGRGVGRSAPLGGAVFYYNNPRDLFDRLHLLGGSIRAENNSAKNEFSEIAHTFL